jgi:dTDP-4-dehydrorhamnose 3,5-epimerase
MKVVPLAIPEVLQIEPRVHRDGRGHFVECFHAARYAEAGVPGGGRFVQDNLSRSTRGVLRGLHLQVAVPQAKLISVAEGEVYDVAVDVRRGSPTFGRAVGGLLSSENARQLLIPEGFAHGFAVLSETAVVVYKCTAYYEPSAELTIRWDDPTLAIPWPVSSPILSERDRIAPLLSEIPADALPVYSPRTP